MNVSSSTSLTAGTLSHWHAVLAASVRDERPDLTLRQLAVLLSVYVTPAPHTVRGLAQGLAMSKPAVTRALDRLSMMGLVRRKRDPADRRNVLVQRTITGSVYLTDLADLIAEKSSMAATPFQAA